MKNLTEILNLEENLNDRLFKRVEGNCNNYLKEKIAIDKLRLELFKGKTLVEAVEITKSCKRYSHEFAIAIDEKGLIFAIEDTSYHGVSKGNDSNTYMIEATICSNSHINKLASSRKSKSGFHQLINHRFVDTGVFNPYSGRNDEMPVFDRVI